MKENLLKQDQQRSNWKLVYNSLGLWIPLYLILIALGFYLFSADHLRSNPASKNLNTSLISSTDDTLDANSHSSLNTKTIVTANKKMQGTDKK